jgi:hypothetical protein
MHIKSLALVAAAVMTAGAAQAADLNKPAKVAVDYVKVCDAYGAGFFYIPGSDTCLKISGFARLDIATGGQSKSTTFGNTGWNINRGTNAFATGVRGDVTFDARTNTSYGLLRSFIEAHSNLGTSASNSSVTRVELDNAFVQLGGLTAGRTTSKFNFGDAEQANQEYQFELFPDYSVNLLAYTFSFGNGITATLSIEDPTTAGYQATNSAVGAGASNSAVRKAGTTFTYGALNVPDVVAQVNVTQAWGEAQIAAMYHQVYGSNSTLGTKSGVAVFGGVLFNVPQLGAGDQIGIEGGYALGEAGAMYAAVPTTGNVFADAYYSPATGTKLSTEWTIGGVFNHNFSSNLAAYFSLGYVGWSNTFATGKANAGVTEASLMLDWQPVKNFHVQPDVEIRSATLNSVAKADTASTNGTSYVFGVRIKRNF